MTIPPQLALLRGGAPRASRGDTRGTVLITEHAGRMTLRASCACGAPAFPPMELPPGMALELARETADALLRNTAERCSTGDASPACKRQRARRLTLARP